jgi:LysR family glycine cleavage system transcriptional activator
MVLMAAIDGQGVALTRGTLAAGDLAAGRLVKPFDLALPTNWAYVVVYPPEYRDRPKIKTFRAWLLAEAEIDRNVLADASASTGGLTPLH